MRWKYALSSTRQARLTTVNGTVCCPGTRVPAGHGSGSGSGSLSSRVTRWRVRVRPPELGGYPFVAGTGRVALLLCCHFNHVFHAAVCRACLMFPPIGIHHSQCPCRFAIVETKALRSQASRQTCIKTLQYQVHTYA